MNHQQVLSLLECVGNELWKLLISGFIHPSEQCNREGEFLFLMPRAAKTQCLFLAGRCSLWDRI